MSKTDRLLRSVAVRQRVNGVLMWFARLVLVFGGIYAALLIGSRLLSLIIVDLDPLVALAVPAAALLGAMILYRSGGAESAARLVDHRMNTKDLFLTSTRLGGAPGEYKPLVARAAESRAGQINPRNVAPVLWREPTTYATAVVLLLVVSTMYLPRFDPFGLHEEQAKAAERSKELAEQKKLATERIKALSSEPLCDELSDQVEHALKDLQQSFNQMKPQEIPANLDRLNAHQRFIGDQWRKLSEQNLKRLEQSDGTQQFGQANPQAREWKKQLERGDTSGLRKEMEQARDLARRLGQTKNEEEQRQLREELEKKLRSLSEFAKNQAGSTPLDSALRKAMEQVQAAGMQGLSSEALDALDSSLELSALELESLAQSLRDLQALEEALKLIAMGKIANAAGRLDGELTEAFASLEGYAEFYEKVCKECGDCKACQGSGKKVVNGGVEVCPHCNGAGAGLGMRGAGRGRGNVAPEKDSEETDFKTEKSKAAVQAGKMLLQWKESELPEAGEAEINYVQAVQQVKQGVSESILNEQVPPGYHEAIKKYFDSISADEKK